VARLSRRSQKTLLGGRILRTVLIGIGLPSVAAGGHPKARLPASVVPAARGASRRRTRRPAASWIHARADSARGAAKSKSPAGLGSVGSVTSILASDGPQTKA